MSVNRNIIPLLICLSGSLSLIFVQFYARRFYFDNEIVKLFLGSAPNLIVGFWFPFSILLRPKIFTSGHGTAGKFFNLYCAATLLLLIGFEIIRPFEGAQTFDYFDILASLLGVGAAFLLYHLWLKKKLIFPASN